jgi:hypothetical protein
MKRIMLLALLLVMGVFVFSAYADPLPKEVVVINSPDNAVPVQGSVDVMNQVSITGGVEVTNTPLNVNLVNGSQSYEYVVLRYENANAGIATANFQTGLNDYAEDGWEFVSWWHFVPVADTGGVGNWLYIAIMRRPIQ